MIQKTNSHIFFIRNLVLTPGRSRQENAVTNFDEDMLREESFRGRHANCPVKTKLITVVICFQLSNHVMFFLLFYFKKNVKKLLRNFEYSKSEKATKLSVQRPDLSFL